MEAQFRLHPSIADPLEILSAVDLVLRGASQGNLPAEVDLCVTSSVDLKVLAALPVLRSGWELEKPAEELPCPVDLPTLASWALGYGEEWEAWWFGRLDTSTLRRLLAFPVADAALWAHWSFFPFAPRPGVLMALDLDINGPPLLLSAITAREEEDLRAPAHDLGFPAEPW